MRHLKEGDVVDRVMGGGKVAMILKVTRVGQSLIYCGDWTFDRETGAEVDDDLGWGPPPLHTGSYIRPCVS